MSSDVGEKFREQCADFHQRNPDVWRLFVAFAFDRIRRGYKHYSADAIMHRVRWETDAGDSAGYKISNNYVALYARRFMRLHPEHDGFFRTKSKSPTRDKEVIDGDQ